MAVGIISCSIQGSTDRGSKQLHLLQSHLLQFDVTPAGGRYCSYLLPKQDGVTSNCRKWAICCNYLARILTPCPAYLCSLKYLGNKVFGCTLLSIYWIASLVRLICHHRRRQVGRGWSPRSPPRPPSARWSARSTGPCTPRPRGRYSSLRLQWHISDEFKFLQNIN